MITLLLQPILFLLLTFTFFFFVVPISIIVLPFNRLTRFRLSSKFWQKFFQTTLFILCGSRVLKIDRRDEESKKKLSPKGLYIANHQSFMDIPLIFSTVISPPIMKKSLIYIPVFGLCAYSSGALLVNRNKKGSRKKVLMMAMKRLTSGLHNMMYYPEGSRNRRSDSPKEFGDIKTPIMRFAFEKGISVYPVSMYGTDKIIVKNQIRVGKKIGVIFHAGINPKDYSECEVFLIDCWKKVQEGHQELKEKLAST